MTETRATLRRACECGHEMRQHINEIGPCSRNWYGTPDECSCEWFVTSRHAADETGRGLL